MIKPWIITISHGSNIEKCYGAYAEADPTDMLGSDVITQISDELWNEYGWMVIGSDEDSISVDEYDELCGKFIEDCSICAEDDKYDEIEELEIIYDERDDSFYVEEE